jgi:hypothetical protein
MALCQTRKHRQHSISTPTTMQVPTLDFAAMFQGAQVSKRRGRPPKNGAGSGAKRGPKAGCRTGTRGTSLSQRTITVPLLISMGVLSAGGKVHVSHRADTAEGTLQEDGSVMTEGETFEDCGAFATAVKRRSAPNCRSDDGWRSCMYEGRSLHEYRTDALEA